MPNLKRRSGYSVWKWPVIRGGCLAFVVMLFYVMPVWAEYGATIEKFTCLSADFFWNDGEKIVATNSQLQIGDKIVVRKVNSWYKKNGTFVQEPCSIRLKLNNNEKLTLEHKDTIKRPYVVVNMSSKKGIFGNVSDWIWAKTVGLLKRDPTTFRATTRGLEMPLLREKITSKLEAGKEVVYVAWKGGKGPYQVTVKEESRPQNKWEKSTSNHEVEVRENSRFKFIKNKVYVVTVSYDSGNVETKGKFKIVADLLQELPNMEAPNIKLLKDIRGSKKMDWAIYLANQKGLEWKFEAYQQMVARKNNTDCHLVERLKSSLLKEPLRNCAD